MFDNDSYTGQLKAIHHRGTEDTEFYFVNAPAARLTIKGFSLCPLCLCGEKFLIFFLTVIVNGC